MRYTWCLLSWADLGQKSRLVCEARSAVINVWGYLCVSHSYAISKNSCPLGGKSEERTSPAISVPMTDIWMWLMLDVLLGEVCNTNWYQNSLCWCTLCIFLLESRTNFRFFSLMNFSFSWRLFFTINLQMGSHCAVSGVLYFRKGIGSTWLSPVR